MKRSGLRFPAAVAAVFATASAATLIWAGQAAAEETITVCASGCQYTTIQEAINHASNGATIQIGAGTYSAFEVREPSRTGLTSVTLEGAGASKTIISGGGTGGAVVRIDRGASVAISGVTITNGKGEIFGGGIRNEGGLTLTNTTVSASTAGTSGGGIGNRGVMTLTKSTVTGGAAGITGGGISNEGVMTLTKSTVTGSTAGTSGGGIENERELTLSESTVSGNKATSGGGGIAESFEPATLTLNNSTVSGNTTEFGTGGGIEGIGPMTLNNSTVSGNTAGRFGGGIWEQDFFNPSKGVTLNNSTVTGNHAAESGGGIENLTGTSTLNNSTVSRNTAGEFGGGILNGSTLKLSGSHVSENTALSGGGIYNEGTATLALENSAITNNTGGGIFNAQFPKPGIVTLVNSQVSGNSPYNCKGTTC